MISRFFLLEQSWKYIFLCIIKTLDYSISSLPSLKAKLRVMRIQVKHDQLRHMELLQQVISKEKERGAEICHPDKEMPN